MTDKVFGTPGQTDDGASEASPAFSPLVPDAPGRSGQTSGLPRRVAGRRRDRRGRGARGLLIPPALPGARSKAGRFDRLVEGAVARLERAWAAELRRIEVTVEDVPTADPASWEGGMVPLARSFARHGGQPARITVYRRPIEARAVGDGELAILVLDVLVEHVANLLGKRPEDIDPGYGY